MELTRREWVFDDLQAPITLDRTREYDVCHVFSDRTVALAYFPDCPMLASIAVDQGVMDVDGHVESRVEAYLDTHTIALS
jgi:hypothetical protein